MTAAPAPIASPDELAHVHHLIASYCRSVDSGAFDDLERLFAPNGEFVIGDEQVSGSQAIRAWLERRQTPERRGSHIATNLVVWREDGQLRSSCAFVFFRYVGGALAPVTAGTYHDVFVKHRDALLLSRRIVERMTPFTG